ncbi:MAG: phosphate ABC transporter permease PstA [Chlorobi bacterium]|nr:phosphate ABC transporter permease PstA [Chlorobiota bacterium]
MNTKKIKYRKIKNNAFGILIYSITALSTLPLIFILYYLTKMGISAISWEFFVSLPAPPGEVGGGISNALVGTLLLILWAMIFSVPTGIILGIYLAETGKSRMANIARTAVETLQGTPSIVIGIIVYLWVVLPMNGFSALSGSIALAIMMLPIVAKSTEETLKLIPHAIKEASLALGVPYYKTIIKVILPAGINGIVTGILIAVSRVTGETAPLLFTAFGNPFMSTDMMKPINSLPLLIFNYAGSPYKEWHEQAWGASFVLVAMVLLFNISAKVITKKWKIKY